MNAIALLGIMLGVAYAAVLHAATWADIMRSVARQPHPQQSRTEQWCSDRCEAVVCLKPGSVAYVNCWSCCYETCKCRGGQREHCGEAVEACAPSLTLACPGIVKQAPTPPRAP